MKKKPYIRYVILGILATLMVGCIIRIAMPNREWGQKLYFCGRGILYRRAGI